MNKESKDNIKHVVLTALGVGLAAVLTYLAGLLQAYTG